MYTTVYNDTPARIAAKLTGNPARMHELVSANPHKPRAVGVGGVPTFQTLGVGERLNTPAHWGVGRAPRGVGQTSSDFDTAVNDAVNQAISNNTTIGGATGSSAAQNAALNIVTFASNGGDICHDPNGMALVGAYQQIAGDTVDGKYGPQTRGSIVATLASISGAPSAPPVCTSFGSTSGGGGGGGGGGGVTPPPPPPTPVPGVTPTSLTTTSGGMNTALIVGGVVVAAGLATIAYLATKKKPGAASAAPAHRIAHRVARRRR